MSVRSLTEAPDPDAVPIWPVTETELAAWSAQQPPAVTAWIERTGFKAKAGRTLPVPGEGGSLAGVVLGLGEEPDLWAYGGLARGLPAGTYRIAADLDGHTATQAALAWALGDYEFKRYRKKADDGPIAVLAVPEMADVAAARRAHDATVLVRDLVNTPAEDMGPAELAAVAETLAREHGAVCRIIVGEDLLAENYPAIHAVGRASTRAPRLIDVTWGEPAAPRLTLVGKGVCFDSGGLDLKSANAMKLMKKDMGGAATVLGLAHMVMAAGLRTRLRVLIPAVENSVAGNAIRPGDVLATRKGLAVEIGNTDAEGRLVLADALALADEEAPDLLIDCATLTGAARSALGPDIPALYTPDDGLAAALASAAQAESDAVWRLPLWRPYREFIESKIADIDNAGDSPFAGSITAALFLQDFVTATERWLHLDLFAWNHKARPGRPAGGEAMGMRALYRLLAERYG